LKHLSPHGLHWPTVDEGIYTAALTSASLMLLGRRNATTGGSGNNLASENKGNPFVDLFFFVLQEVISVNFSGL